MHIVCPSCHIVNNLEFSRLNEAPICGKCKKPLFLKQVLKLDQASFNKHTKQSDLPVIVDYWASWCGPCKMMAPVFEQIASELEPRFRFAKLDTEKYQAIATSQRIQSIPTLVVYKKGREIDRMSGALPSPQLKQWLNNLKV